MFVYRPGRLAHRELVVDFVDVFVDAPVVQYAVEEVVPGVLDDSAAEAPSQKRRPERQQRRGVVRQKPNDSPDRPVTNDSTSNKPYHHTSVKSNSILKNPKLFLP